MNVLLRPVRPEDRDFLYHLYISTREEELRWVPWSVEQKQAFLQMQFHAQDTYYRQVYPADTFQVVVVDGVDAGRLYLAELPTVLEVVDIIVEASYRNRGIGTLLLVRVLDRARELGRPVLLSVAKDNPAQRLSERLGFERLPEEHLDFDYIWRPTA